MKERQLPDFEFELKQMAEGFSAIAGVDEAGRGPLAGPVVAAAVVLDPKNIPEGLNDSKVLSPKRRAALFEDITQAARVSIAQASIEEIDEINIYHASHLAMSRAVAGLGGVDFVLVDGNKVPVGINTPAQGIVKGDARALSIAAASIMAKVTRDRIMVDLGQQHPAYNWGKNKGYPTKEHIRALEQHGVTQHHRKTFGPVHNILCR